VRFHGPEWRPPRGYYYRAWRYGEVLPRGWYGEDYSIDWSDYDLPEPPPGFDWIRTGADALLVEEGSGRIVQVVRAVFW
jgi:Ni/Co efflux regulator RcnB